MRRLFLLALVLLINTALFAQTGKIEGKVTDANTGQPLAGVSVVEKLSGKGTATTAEGRYIINVEGKLVSLVFSYNGVTQQVDDIEVLEGKVTTQNLAITPKTKTEEGVVVRATSNARKETAAAIISRPLLSFHFKKTPTPLLRLFLPKASNARPIEIPVKY